MNNDDVVIEPDELSEGGSEEELDALESRVDAKVTKLKKELEQVKAEKQEYLDGWQRAKADYVNALKRFESEKAGAIELGKVVSVQAFLPAIDSLERAEAAGEVPEAFKGIAKQLHDAARALGLEKIGKIGETFDPNMHEALGQDTAPSPDKDDTVTVVLETGWKSKESVVRPAKVRVAHFEG
ncbi:MAG: nucleotide exchange factor GrpE [Patescibacteria group bacterium]